MAVGNCLRTDCSNGRLRRRISVAGRFLRTDEIFVGLIVIGVIIGIRPAIPVFPVSCK